MIIAGTGHRPNKLGSYKLPNPTYNYVCQETEKVLLAIKPEKVISGGALGFDQYLAVVAHKLGIPFLMAVPFIGQESAWPAASQKAYRQLLKLASEVVIVSPGGYAPEKMQVRNQYLVDNCDLLVAVYNGDAVGGTANCVAYAKKVNREIIFIDLSL